jgi:hypothetical protein
LQELRGLPGPWDLLAQAARQGLSAHQGLPVQLALPDPLDHKG